MLRGEKVLTPNMVFSVMYVPPLYHPDSHRQRAALHWHGLLGLIS
jgi:hypothetical protein